MDGSDASMQFAPHEFSEVYNGPPDQRVGARHAVYPALSHDEVERFNFLTQMNRHLATRVAPMVEATWNARIEPGFEAEHGRKPADRNEARKALLGDPVFQTWSALRRMTMEQRQEAGRWAAIRQSETLAATVATLASKERLTLDPSVAVPRYVTAVDHHCMPGSYHSELFPGDVSGPASYDSGLHVTVGGRGGPYNDGIGQALAQWVKETYPNFKPWRILDLGTTTGHNLLPMARAFPEADVIGVDVGVPVLRYGSARAEALGVNNVRFQQADATDLSRFEDDSVDLVMTTMFLHELSRTAMDAIFAEAHRVLSPGGLIINMEQPGYAGMTPFEQAMRDWDAHYNNEPFWTTLHSLDLDKHFVGAGFDRAKLVKKTFTTPAEPGGQAKLSMVFVGAVK